MSRATCSLEHLGRVFVEVFSFRLVGPFAHSLRERRSFSLSASTHPLACLDRFVSPFPSAVGRVGFPGMAVCCS